ncbi:FAD/NAD-P-binding domain-containing protein [Trametes maxima]|nr:FAD/NAD-P-binding domain-containing protein [Trametes maxima]
MQQTQKSFEVAIVGGGVCGLTCAIALQRAGVPVQLFEAAAAFGEIGAGIGIGANAIRALQAMGVWHHVRAKCSESDLQLQGFIFRSGMGDHREIYRYPAEEQDVGLGIHRAVFLDSLVGAVDPKTTHFHKRLTSITESTTNPGRSVLHFQDGTTHETDIVLGADGIKSAVRKHILDGENGRVAFTNTVAYRGLIPYDQLKAAGFTIDLVSNPTNFMGENKHFILFAVNDGQIINAVAFDARYDIEIGEANLPEGAPWVEHVTREEVQRVYEGWGPEVTTLLECMPEKPSKWSIHALYPPLDTYVKGKVALLGDSAHGMLPHLGAGAGQGLEDALMLVRLLSHPHTSLENIETVLQVYSDVRRPRAQAVWEGSRRAGRTYDGHGLHGTDWDKVPEDLDNQWRPVWRHDLDGDFDAAVALLRERGAFPVDDAV